MAGWPVDCDMERRPEFCIWEWGKLGKMGQFGIFGLMGKMGITSTIEAESLEQMKTDLAGSGSGSGGDMLGCCCTEGRHITWRNPGEGRELLRPSWFRGDICHLCDCSVSKHFVFYFGLIPKT